MVKTMATPCAQNHEAAAIRSNRKMPLVLLSQKATVTGISESFMEANRTEATGGRGWGRHGGEKTLNLVFTGLCRGACERDRPRGSGGSVSATIARVLVMPGGAQRAWSRWRRSRRPGRTAAQHQSFAAFWSVKGAWSDEDVLTKVRQMVFAADDTRRADRGLDHRRYRPAQKRGSTRLGCHTSIAGSLARQANCQVAGDAVACPITMRALPAAYRLYLPNAWAEDDDRRAKAGGARGDHVQEPSRRIALEQIRWGVRGVGLPGSMALLDAGYGHDFQAARGYH